MDQTPLSDEELAAEGVSALPNKEVMSLLDLNANLDLGLAVAAPVDLAVAANANVAAPIEAGVGANVLSVGSTAEGLAQQHASITQGIDGSATATTDQHSGISQSGVLNPTPAATSGATSTPGTGLGGNLLNVNVDANAQAGVTAPIDGAVAANANVAAPIDAAAGANIGSVGSVAVASAPQDVTIDQHITGSATATGTQTSSITQ